MSQALSTGCAAALMMTRRTLLSAALLAGCGRKLAPRYFGWLFVASAAERAIAVADLAEFHRVTTILLPRAPAQVLRAGEQVFVTCTDSRTIFEIDPLRLRVSGRIELAGKIIAAAVVPESKRLAALTVQPSALWLIDPVAKGVLRRTGLPEQPAGFDVTEHLAAVAASAGNSVARISLADGSLAGTTNLGFPCGPVRFRMDGKAILAGASRTSEIATVDAASGALLARLPLPFVPANFCFNGDGGQMFVTGGEDTIAIVNTYPSEVDQTIVAGRRPVGMAVAPQRNLLLVTNAGSGDLTILDIETRMLAASVHIGGDPGEVLLTPDEEYALVVGRDSGDVSVVRMNTVLDHAVKTKPLFTVFAMGANPQSAAIIPHAS